MAGSEIPRRSVSVLIVNYKIFVKLYECCNCSQSVTTSETIR